jgi:23S rRNA pseudouridine1911/1915/1917 synthase
MRWIVRAGDGATVGAVLARAGAEPRAVRDGRVFLGRRRVRDERERVVPGDELHVASATQPQSGAAARIILHEGDLVAVDKPAGTPTIADHAGSAHALVALVARHLGVDPGRLHPTSRLDRDVSGVVFFALTNTAARRLASARAAGLYERRYVAIASRAPAAPDQGTWDAPIGRAPDPRLRAVAGRAPVPATTRYALCGRAPSGVVLLALAPLTGRTHQIRVHAAHAGAPLIGDRSYGGPVRLTLPGGRVLEVGRIALHAARVVVPDERGRPIAALSPIPAALCELWSALGGDGAAWQLSASCATGPSSDS